MTAFIADAVRTPFGRYAGGLSAVRPDDLAAQVIAALVARHPGLDPAGIDDVILGNANGAGEENRNVARMAVLLAGLPTTVPGTTVNRLCGSGMQAVMDASRLLETGDAEVVIAGGVESMSRAPWVLPKPESGFPRNSVEMASTTLGWRLVNPRMDDRWTTGLMALAESLAEREGISREDQDAFAVRSQASAAAAWDEGFYADEVIAVPEAELDTDEQIRRGTTEDALARLRPVVHPKGSVTAGNSSGLNDGAAAILLVSENGLARAGVTPIARVVSRAAAGVDPDIFGLGPVEAANTALTRAGISWSDLVAVEVNEAFASQALACVRSWPELNPDIVNTQGGAIAIGHPLGASGARVVGTLARRLQETPGYGLATLCIGVGQGLAVVLQSV